MDYLALFRTLARHRWVVGCVMLATAAGLVFVVFVTPELYKQTSSVVILQPRNAPSQNDLEASPDLASVDAYNPFSGDPSLIVGVVSARLSSDETRKSFQVKGLDPRYEVAGALSYGTARPELLITAYGSSVDQVSKTGDALTEAVTAQLTAVQGDQGVAPYYMVKALPIAPTDPPQKQTSSMVRSALAVCGVGAIILFGLISVLTAFDQSRAERAARSLATDSNVPLDGAEPAPQPAGADLAPGQGWPSDPGPSPLNPSGGPQDDYSPANDLAWAKQLGVGRRHRARAFRLSPDLRRPPVPDKKS